MASVVPGARVAASCCAARFAATTAVYIVATAATLGEIIADGLCMLLASHVQRSPSLATLSLSAAYFDISRLAATSISQTAINISYTFINVRVAAAVDRQL